jgi:hypothetical protein
LNLLTFLISRADVFDNSGATPFQVLATVPDLLPPARAVDRETTDNTDLADSITDDIEASPTAAMTQANDFIGEPLISNDTDAIPPLNAGASGQPALPNAGHENNGAVGGANPPALPSSQDLSAVASISAQDPGELTAPAIPEMADNDGTDLSARTSESANKGLLEKRYQRPQKMVPGVAITARFEVRSHRSCATNSSYRNLCAIDWCALHPEGTLGEFNYYFDNLPLVEADVCTFILHTRTSTSTI